MDEIKKLIFEFYGEKAAEARDAFISWYLDGGGDSGFDSTCDDRSISIDDCDWDLDSDDQIIRIFAKEPTEFTCN